MRWLASFVIGVLFISVSAGAQSGPNDARAREIYKELVEINTTDSVGNTTRAAEAMAARLKAAGVAGGGGAARRGPAPRARSAQGQPGRALSRHRCAQTAPAARAPGRRRSQARRLVV